MGFGRRGENPGTRVIGTNDFALCSVDYMPAFSRFLLAFSRSFPPYFDVPDHVAINFFPRLENDVVGHSKSFANF